MHIVMPTIKKKELLHFTDIQFVLYNGVKVFHCGSHAKHKCNTVAC